MPSATVSPPLESELVQVVLEALAKAPGPCTPAELRKLLSGPFQLKPAALADLLAAQSAAGKLFAYSKSGKPTYWTRDLDQHCRATIALLAAEPKPRKELEKALKQRVPGLEPARIARCLDELLAAGGLHVWPGKTARLARQAPPDLGPQVRQALLDAAAEPVERKKLDAAAAKATGASPADLERAFQALRASGALCEWPPAKGKTPRYANRAPQLADFATRLTKPLGEVRAVCESLAAAGTSRGALLEQLAGLLFPGSSTSAKPTEERPAAVVQPPLPTAAPEAARAEKPAAPAAAVKPSAPALGAPPQASPVPEAPKPVSGPFDAGLAQAIFDRITQVDPSAAQGALVSLRDLRRSMEFQNPSKEQFDRAVLALADRGRVFLHEHDYPDSLSPEERRALVVDEQGHYYIGVMLS